MMRFYMTPGSCSTGIHVLLEECGLVFEAHIIDLLRGQNRSREYLAINPHGSIPALVLDDGEVLADWSGIALYLAQTHPRRKLLPTVPRDRLRALGYLSEIVENMHGEGFTRIFTTDNYADGSRDAASIRAQGERIASDGFAVMAAALQSGRWLFEDFSIADAALFYVEFWADHIKLALPPRCQQHFEACLKRPAVRQVLLEEGYGRLFARH